MADLQTGPAPAGSSPPVHVRNTFAFTVRAPERLVAPLFGANRERVWAEDWDPQFMYPQPPGDESGAVFTLLHGQHRATWITTIYEPERGRIQHVYVIPDVMTTIIDIQTTQASASSTSVRVTYERTALSREMNDHVKQQGESDAGKAAEWKQAIDTFLAKGE